MTMKLNKPAVEAARDWWQRLHPNPVTGRGGDRAGRARLRRASGPLEALLEPQTQALIETVRRASGKAWALQVQYEDEETLLLRFGVLAILLAETDVHFEERQRGFAVLLGQTPDGLLTSENKDRRWSVSRFGAMMRAWKEPDDFCRHVRRALPVLKREPFDVAAFIRDVIGFDGAVQRKWTFDYYGRPQLAAGDGKAGAQESPAAGHDSPEEN
ncbi:type I-E CRISPR-associated protein Cse2/CasB [Pannonibacter phragmitetus]|uniref:type I-E CRISPR-associated protein Cse2/CasB n=1 Tax=Pannonibacter phragmitetus TaxID=121719 RepID=UPI000B9743AB|nr:type I-E CRISPR-associated protein Cse2/CasB [Pannonibacter phragmitetus]